MKRNSEINVLIAEDEYLISEEIERSVKKIGCKVIGKASNGEEAVKMVLEKKPDIVLMDIHMPKLNGIEATLLIQEKCPTPVVILSAHESTDMLDIAKNSGISAYLTKPAKPAEIDRAIVVAVARHEDLMELRKITEELKKKNIELEDALKEIKTLRGIIPICSNCKKIRDDRGSWHQMEKYISKYSEAVFSHGICDKCSKELYPEFFDKS
jgi:two-component system, response regulator PdtaR